MKPKFDNAEVKATFYQIAQLGGDSKKIDTKVERDKLAEYLAGNADNLSDNDFAILDSFAKSGQDKNVQKAPTDNIEIDVNAEKGSVSQINIGTGNENTVNVKTEVPRPPMGLDMPNTNEAKPVEDKKTEKKVDEKSVADPPANKKPDDVVKGKPVQEKPRDEFKYNIWVNMMPGPGVKHDLEYIKKTVISKIQDFPLANIADICKAVAACGSQDEVTKCLAKFGIGVTYPC